MELFEIKTAPVLKESPEKRLILAVIKSAFIEKDWEYFESDTFRYHCWLLNLNAGYIRRRAKREFGI